MKITRTQKPDLKKWRIICFGVSLFDGVQGVLCLTSGFLFCFFLLFDTFQRHSCGLCVVACSRMPCTASVLALTAAPRSLVSQQERNGETKKEERRCVTERSVGKKKQHFICKRLARLLCTEKENVKTHLPHVNYRTRCTRVINAKSEFVPDLVCDGDVEIEHFWLLAPSVRWNLIQNLRLKKHALSEMHL
jgi:hypothetical protein